MLSSFAKPGSVNKEDETAKKMINDFMICFFGFKMI